MCTTATYISVVAITGLSNSPAKELEEETCCAFSYAKFSQCTSSVAEHYDLFGDLIILRQA